MLSLSKAFNNFAFKNRISTDYTFMTDELSHDLREKVRNGNEKLIALEPALAPILIDSAETDGCRPIDDSCMTMAEDRANHYLKTREK